MRSTLDWMGAAAGATAPTLREWSPDHATANQNVTGATAAAADDNNGAAAQAFNFTRNQNNSNNTSRKRSLFRSYTE